jgi:hypothetical protein
MFFEYIFIVLTQIIKFSFILNPILNWKMNIFVLSYLIIVWINFWMISLNFLCCWLYFNSFTHSQIILMIFLLKICSYLLIINGKYTLVFMEDSYQKVKILLFIDYKVLCNFITIPIKDWFMTLDNLFLMKRILVIKKKRAGK